MTDEQARPRTMTAGYESAYRNVQSLDGCKAFMKELDAERAVSDALLKALKLMWSMFDDGRIVRNIANDGEPDWALRMLTFTKELQTIQAAIQLAEARHAE